MTEDVNILNENSITSILVSSVLNKNAKEYGKKHLYDGKEATCWNSDQGLPQYIIVKYPSPELIRKFKITSQGGFCPKVINLHLDGILHQSFEGLDTNFE